MKTPLKVGDRVRVYGSSQAGVNLNGYPATVSNNLDKDGWVLIKLDEPVYTGKIPNISDTFTVHPKQCRRLVKKPKLRIRVKMSKENLMFDINNSENFRVFEFMRHNPDNCLDFIEVKPKAGSK